MESAAVILAFSLFIGGFAALVVWSVRAERKRQGEMTAIANANGWRYEHQQRSGKRAARFTYMPDGPAPDGAEQHWQLQVSRRRSGGKGRSSHPGSSEFCAPSPTFQNGLVVVMPEMGKGIAGAAASMLGFFDNKIGRALMAKALGPEIGEHLGQLQAFDPPEDLRVMVLATADPALWFDLGAIARGIHAWNPKTGSDRSAPMVVIDSSGLRLRLNYEIPEPALVERFIALGRQVQREAAPHR
ncbi:MAG: hypothetical protein ACK4LQ_00460 [Pararhodobacter sp.]